MIADSKRLLILAGAALIAFSVYAAAFSWEPPSASFKSSVSYASIAGTEGRAYFWVTNEGSEDLYASFTADLGEFNGYFEDAFAVVPAKGAKGSWLYFSAPNCMRGYQTIIAFAQICDEEWHCTVKEKRIQVSVTPSKECGYLLNGSVQWKYFEEPREVGDGARIKSRIEYSRFFDPTEYDARIYGADRCKELYSGEWARVPLTVMNRGAAGTFDLKLVGDKYGLNALLSNEYVSLVRNGAQEVFVDVSPSRLQAGRYWVTLQVLKNGVVIQEKDVCVDVLEKLGARLVLPQFIEASACGPTVVKATIQNTGTAPDSYEIVASEFARVYPAEVELGPGAQADVQLEIDASLFEPGSSVLLMVGATSAKQLRGEGNATVFVKPCGPSGQVGVTESKEQDFVKVVVSVENALPEPLENVSVEVTEIPEAWEVLTEGNVVIPGNSVRNLTLWIKPTTEEKAEPVLVVKNNDDVIATKKLPAMGGEPVGLTGFVVMALSQNALLIALLIIVALLVIVFTSRGKFSEEDEYKKKLKDIKESIYSGEETKEFE